MRLPILATALVVPLAAPAQQTAPITTTPLPPSSAPDQAQPATPLPTPRPSPPPWIPASTAQLQVLDKVNAQNALLTIKVGQEAEFGTLSIQVQACDVRPPDQPQDAAAYLTITDSHADAPGFRGWMMANNPSLSMLQHPLYDVRVVGCKA